MRCLKLAFVALCFLLVACSVSTKDGKEALKYWTNTSTVNDSVVVLYGEYYRSPHFTLEYKAHFKLVIPKKESEQLIELNALEYDSVAELSAGERPEWFVPSDSYRKYSSPKSLYGQGLKVWMQEEGDTIYIEDIQYYTLHPVIENLREG